MEIKISRKSEGLSYEIEVPDGTVNRMVFEDLAKIADSIEEFFENDKELNQMTLSYD